MIIAACATFDFKGPAIRLLHSYLMTITLDDESQIKNRLGRAQVVAQFMGEFEDIIEFQTSAGPLNSILKEARSPNQIDLLPLDTEDAKLEMLNRLHQSEYRYKFIVIEIRSFESMKTCLVSLDYQLVEN